ncbi:MAG TPA: helix-turn-helix domain-containing protein [Planctomycetota bacterium]
MKKPKRDKLAAAGWKVGDITDFLELSAEEAAMVEIKISLADSIRRRRIRRKLSQEALAKLLKSSQSRVAKMEAADPSVTIDLLLRSLLAMGATRRDVARLLSAKAA